MRAQGTRERERGLDCRWSAASPQLGVQGRGTNYRLHGTAWAGGGRRKGAGVAGWRGQPHVSRGPLVWLVSSVALEAGTHRLSCDFLSPSDCFSFVVNVRSSYTGRWLHRSALGAAERRMSRSLRGPTRKAAVEIPQVARCTFLIDAAKEVAGSIPQIASYLGQSALRLADAERAPLHRRSAEQLCRRCGLPLVPSAGAT